MSSPQFGERVRVRKSEAHEHPVYMQGSREIEIGAEPVSVMWGGYYHDLQRSGAVEVVPEDTE
jgi:hypothetical protein